MAAYASVFRAISEYLNKKGSHYEITYTNPKCAIILYELEISFIESHLTQWGVAKR